MTSLNKTIRALCAGVALTLTAVLLFGVTRAEDPADRRAQSDAASSRDTGERAERMEAAPAEQGGSGGIDPQPVTRVVYRPPRTGSPAPDRRIGGATRGDSAVPVVVAIAPDHEGLTIRGQPDLCWYLSRSEQELPIVFTLIESDGIRPLVEQAVTSPVDPGIQVIRVSDYGAELKVGRSYVWSVSIVPDPEHRSRDIVASGVIRRVPPPSEAVTEALSGSDPMRALRVSAGTGLWYEAVVALVRMLEAAPHDAALEREWAGLLEQVSLSDPVLRPVEGL